MRRMNGLEWAMLLALAALWGGSYFFGKVAVSELPPLTAMLGRVGFAALALAACCAFAGVTVPRAAWPALLVMAALNNVAPMSLILWAQTELASGLAAILNATTPIFTVLLAHLLTRDERLNLGKGAGVLLGFAGVAVLVGPGALLRLDGSLLAPAASLAAACCYACAGLWGRRLRALSPLAAATGQLCASAALALPIALAADRPWTLANPSPQVWGAVIGIALACTALAYVLYFRILRTAGATNLLLVTFLIPASAILLGWLFLGERLLSQHVAGLALIAAGLAAIDGRLAALLRPARAAPRASC